MKFFVVDDDPDALALVECLLVTAGHEVVTCNSSVDALRDIPSRAPDCVITDLMMPGMDGFELTRGLRRRKELARTKILILSAKSYDFDRRRAKEMGADGYLTKPINRETFLKSINEIVSDRIAVHYWGVHGTLPRCRGLPTRVTAATRRASAWMWAASLYMCLIADRVSKGCPITS